MTKAAERIKPLVSAKLIEALGSKFRDLSVYTIKNEVVASFEIEGSRLTFQELLKLSAALGTDKVDIGSAASRLGCETCGHGNENWIDVEAHDVKVQP